MSNRTLLEFNHDKWDEVQRDPFGLAAALVEMMRGGPDDQTISDLRMWGIIWHGQRHHSDAYRIQWGSHSSSDKPK